MTSKTVCHGNVRGSLGASSVFTNYRKYMECSDFQSSTSHEGVFPAIGDRISVV